MANIRRASLFWVEARAAVMVALLVLVVAAGPFAAGETLEAVRFNGNRALSRHVLAQLVSARPGKPTGDAQLVRDAATIERVYEEQGFRHVRVERSVVPGRRRPVAVFNIEEGPRTKIAGIDIAGANVFPAATLLGLLPCQPGGALVFAQLGAGLEAIRNHYLNSGYPFVEVTLDQPSLQSSAPDDTLVWIGYTIAEGPRCRIREVRVRGNRTVRTPIITRASELRAGQWFSQRELYAAQRRLYSTRLFSRVAFFVLRPDSAADEVVVRFDVTEQQYRGFSVGAGVEATPIRLLSSVEWEHDNLFGIGHTAVIGAEVSPDLTGNYRANLNGRYRIPYLVLTRIDFQTRPSFTYEVTDSLRRIDYSIETGMSRNVAPQLVVGIANRLRFVRPSLTGITNSVGLSLQYDSRNDIFDPSRGIYAQTTAEAAGGVLGGNNDFRRLTAEVRSFAGLGPRLVLAARAMAGAVLPFGRIERAPYYESFTLGGRNSLRGYDERSLGPDSAPGFWRYGPTVLNANIELRSGYFFRWVGLVVFFDIGQVTNRIEFTELEYGAGLGIRVRTPIGPVRLDWGKRLRNATASDHGRFYLGLLHAF